MESTTLVIALIIIFTIIGVGSSVVYYFARYYVKTDKNDDELLTKKPLNWSGDKSLDAVNESREPVAKTLSGALTETRAGFWGRLSRLFSQKEISGGVKDEIEEILYTSDLGPKTAEELLVKVTDMLSQNELGQVESLQTALRSEMLRIIEQAPRPLHTLSKIKDLNKSPIVWMVMGINGAGKTTTIGKLAHIAIEKGLKTLIVSADTFRAAADSQLQAWAARAQCDIHSPAHVKDPSAVIFSGLEKAKSGQYDFVIIDTAGRLHTHAGLMEELKKMTRVMSKVLPEAPHEKLIVIDASAGQNALNQAKEYNAAVGLTGAIITKMDGTSKAGVAVGIVNEVNIPIMYIGIGESVRDLKEFNAQEFVSAII